MSDPAAPPPPASLPAPEVVVPAGGRSERSALLIVFLVVVIDLLGFGIVLPLLPIYGENYVAQLFTPGDGAAAATAAGKDWRVGAVVGLLMASFSAMQFLFAPVWGRVSDRIGRRPILLIGLAGSVAFYLLF